MTRCHNFTIIFSRNSTKTKGRKIMVVCFVGHRTIDNAKQLKTRLTATIARLITDGADTFLFGSHSQFDSLCWEIVTEQQKQYPSIQRVNYTAPHETVFTSKEERQRFELIVSKLVGKEVTLKEYESAVSSLKSTNATKDTYVMRNQDMIDNSDVCVFYYNPDYLPPRRKQSQRHVLDYQPHSGTALAYGYAKRKKKTIINVFD